MTQRDDKMTYEEAMQKFDEWLENCPVSYYETKHPTSGIISINFDFKKYESEDE